MRLQRAILVVALCAFWADGILSNQVGDAHSYFEKILAAVEKLDADVTTIEQNIQNANLETELQVGFNMM